MTIWLTLDPQRCCLPTWLARAVTRIRITRLYRILKKRMGTNWKLWAFPQMNLEGKNLEWVLEWRLVLERRLKSSTSATNFLIFWQSADDIRKFVNGLGGEKIILLEKSNVNGDNAHPLIQAFKKATGSEQKDIKWNFGKSCFGSCTLPFVN